MNLTVKYTAQARKRLRSLHIDVQRMLKKAIKDLEKDPDQGKQLGGELAGFRSIRVGKYRVIYSVQPPETVLVHTLGHRREVYTSSSTSFVRK